MRSGWICKIFVKNFLCVIILLMSSRFILFFLSDDFRFSLFKNLDTLHDAFIFGNYKMFVWLNIQNFCYGCCNIYIYFQLMLRISTFIINAIVLRHVTKDLLGVVNVRYACTHHIVHRFELSSKYSRFRNSISQPI